MKNFKKIALVAFFAVCLTIGILSRGIEILNGNYIFGFDHGREYLMTRDIVDYHDLRLIGTPLGAGSAGFQGIFHGPLYYYLLAIPYVLFRGDPYGGVVLMFFFGLCALGVSFLLGKRLFTTNWAIVLTSLLAISPPLIAQSRFIWSPYPSTLFSLIAFYCIVRIREKKIWVFLSAFFSALVYHFEFAIAVPLVITLLVYSTFVLKEKSKKHYALIFSGFITAALPMIIFEIKHNFMAIHGVISYIQTPGRNESANILTYQIDHLGGFLFNVVDSLPFHDNIPALLFLTTFLIALMYSLYKNKKVDSFIIYLLLLPLVTFLSLFMLRNTVYQYYLFHLVVAYNILFVFILQKIKLKTIIRQYALLPFVLLLTVSVLLSVPKFFKMITYDIADYGGDAKIKGKLDAVDYVYKDAKSKDFGVLIFNPPVYTYPYDYLFYWRGKQKYGYIPPYEKKKVTYLIIEVDPYKPWSYEGWLQTVIKDGKVISTVTRPSGIIIQKRTYENIQEEKN